MSSPAAATISVADFSLIFPRSGAGSFLPAFWCLYCVARVLKCVPGTPFCFADNGRGDDLRALGSIPIPWNFLVCEVFVRGDSKLSGYPMEEYVICSAFL